jgi:hypothetical protein
VRNPLAAPYSETYIRSLPSSERLAKRQANVDYCIRSTRIAALIFAASAITAAALLIARVIVGG